MAFRITAERIFLVKMVRAVPDDASTSGLLEDSLLDNSEELPVTAGKNGQQEEKGDEHVFA